MAADVLLFHWSPTERRKQIIRYGLRPNSLSIYRDWKPPYICLADSPSWAWALSGAFHPEYESWDLWQTYLSVLTSVKRVKGSPPHKIHEYRTKHRIYKRNLWYVATRVVERKSE